VADSGAHIHFGTDHLIDESCLVQLGTSTLVSCSELRRLDLLGIHSFMSSSANAPPQRSRPSPRPSPQDSITAIAPAHALPPSLNLRIVPVMTSGTHPRPSSTGSRLAKATDEASTMRRATSSRSLSWNMQRRPRSYWRNCRHILIIIRR
jgi:hypothetical protein